ncbi:uncharacterized protein M421DRAFT_413983 [Didymella exigua CBS 183.55]|uniref:Uncharacterized protein n=1 Tax=Didymella exigua CBS 183.55 TaxID=1150837 RepID=A0A6A5RNQ7_9PLEO|nr:uncharacterized protein M421DRAFT_413983 [Didymella exigua CBS 183.55]KAF1930015.1 hypothetical protein M421DRAFT_413983 [Didymella exigua CBS 183.55]
MASGFSLHQRGSKLNDGTIAGITGKMWRLGHQSQPDRGCGSYSGSSASDPGQAQVEDVSQVEEDCMCASYATRLESCRTHRSNDIKEVRRGPYHTKSIFRKGSLSYECTGVIPDWNRQTLVVSPWDVEIVPNPIIFPHLHGSLVRISHSPGEKCLARCMTASPPAPRSVRTIRQSAELQSTFGNGKSERPDKTSGETVVEQIAIADQTLSLNILPIHGPSIGGNPQFLSSPLPSDEATADELDTVFSPPPTMTKNEDLRLHTCLVCQQRFQTTTLAPTIVDTDAVPVTRPSTFA